MAAGPEAPCRRLPAAAGELAGDSTSDGSHHVSTIFCNRLIQTIGNQATSAQALQARSLSLSFVTINLCPSANKLQDFGLPDTLLPSLDDFNDTPTRAIAASALALGIGPLDRLAGHCRAALRDFEQQPSSETQCEVVKTARALDALLGPLLVVHFQVRARS